MINIDIKNVKNVQELLNENKVALILLVFVNINFVMVVVENGNTVMIVGEIELVITCQFFRKFKINSNV